ncbi:MAG: hypothetical protein ICV51_14215 [Flavisolibacter sp.]|nr:hypothetical protein [Flavisolibacter sp.]MBD0293759.1 hypothetical protein [Flavisolibacter sp.]MBD0352247.1 hypothetical protein [Flavisolibacter sp.]MBD0376771.1 hypothetical protein [Flavisolibacter sp.]
MMTLGRNVHVLFLLVLLTAGTYGTAIAATDNNPPEKKGIALTEEQIVRIEAIKNRVEEIKSMDRSKLSKADRKELRQELKDLNKEAKAISGKGFVLALGIIIIVILVLILLL